LQRPEQWHNFDAGNRTLSGASHRPCARRQACALHWCGPGRGAGKFLAGTVGTESALHGEAPWRGGRAV